MIQCIFASEVVCSIHNTVLHLFPLKSLDIAFSITYLHIKVCLILIKAFKLYNKMLIFVECRKIKFVLNRKVTLKAFYLRRRALKIVQIIVLKAH